MTSWAQLWDLMRMKTEENGQIVCLMNSQSHSDGWRRQKEAKTPSLKTTHSWILKNSRGAKRTFLWPTKQTSCIINFYTDTINTTSLLKALRKITKVTMLKCLLWLVHLNSAQMMQVHLHARKNWRFSVANISKSLSMKPRRYEETDSILTELCVTFTKLAKKRYKP